MLGTSSLQRLVVSAKVRI